MWPKIQALHLPNYEEIKPSTYTLKYILDFFFVDFPMHLRVQDHIMLAISYQIIVNVISTNDTEILIKRMRFMTMMKF